MTSNNTKLAERKISTEIVNIQQKSSTLPIDTMCEWTKGFEMINKIIALLYDSTYEEDFEDKSGVRRTRPKLHPELISFLKERRALMDQYWKISGGEAINEAKKEVSKNLAAAIFDYKLDSELNEKNRKVVIEILEEEVDET